MKILFSPSEKKLTYHPAQIPSKSDFYQDLIAKDSLKIIITEYEQYLKSSTDSAIQKLFGKKIKPGCRLTLIDTVYNRKNYSNILFFDKVPEGFIQWPEKP